MDDSDQDFADLCSKLLKRVRKRPGESRQGRREEQQPSSQAVSGDKSKRNNRRHGDIGSRCAGTQPVSKGEGGDQRVWKGVGGEQPASKGVGGEQPASKGAGGEQPASKGAGGEQPASKGAGGEQPASKGVGGEQPVSKGAGGEQPASKGAGGEQPASKGAGGEQPASKGAGGEQPASKGAGGEKPASKGAGGEQPASKGAGGEQPASKGAGGEQPASKGAGGEQPASKGAGGEQPASKGAGGDQPASKGAGGEQPASKGAGGDQPASKGAGGEQPASKGAGGEQPASKGAGGEQPASKGAGGEQPASKGAGGDQPASKGAGGEQPASKGAGGDQPASKGAGGDQPASKGAGGDQPASKGAGGEQPASKGAGGDQPASKGAGVLCASEAAAAGQRVERGLLAKDKVLLRMQQFKRAGPQRMVHKSQTAKHESDCDPTLPPPSWPHVCDNLLHTLSFVSVLSSEPLDSDEALALRLQQELDREAAESQTVDLEEGGLFFCQICHRDLSHMTPEGRMQHLNRCLDESEQSAQALAPPPPPPGVSDCPICGKKFKSQKSRSAHLKRCSVDLGVTPSVLLQAVQRQAEEYQNVPNANTLTQTGGTKRKGSSKPGLPARKKPRKKTDPLDEDTMVALALSSSLLEQEREQHGERESERPLQTEAAPEHTSVTSGLKWRPDTGKGRGKRKKGAAPRPPLLLLVQDANTALTRLQERVSALLLQGRSPSPPTPTRCPSSLPGWTGAAPLWQKSTLQEGGSTCLSDFYTPELREFITPWESAAIEAASCSTINKPESSERAAAERTPLTGTRSSILPSSSQTASSSPAPSTPVGSQALRDLMELAEDGMTLTQCGYAASGSDGKSDARITNLRLSGFVLDEPEEQADLLTEGTHTRSEETHQRSRRKSDEPGSDKERSVLFSRLASDLSSMVNNPQLSDVQLQVDSGEVYFAHSFMVYARCPLLAEMVHESGFGVQEEGVPAAQRVLISDVPGQAVLALLRYLYSAHCCVPASLRPHVRELASRFDLQELQQLCDLHREDAAAEGDEDDYTNQEEVINNQTDQALVELLRSMWNEEDAEEEEGADTDREGEGKEVLENDHQTDDLAAADAEIHEEKVNEEELEEIYEFAATQRKREGEKDSVEEEEERADEEEDEEELFTKLTEPRRSSADVSVKNLKQNSQLKPDLSLDRSYSRLFSDSWGVYEDGHPPSSTMPSSDSTRTHVPQSQHHQSPLKPTSTLSGRTLLQSSGSIVEENSLSPQASSSNLPVPGPSPGLLFDLGSPAESVTLKRESHGPQSICAPISPLVHHKKKEPELIVLSDSSEEMDEEVLCSRSPSQRSPGAEYDLQSSHTQIKPQPVLESDVASLEKKSSTRSDFSPDQPSAAPVQSYSVDGSPEVSWLIPSTPLQHARSTTSSSTQTRSSMCRTQLFPKPDSSSSSALSSPALPFKKSPTRVSALVGPAEGDVLQVKQEGVGPCSSGSDLKLCSERTSGCDLNIDRDVFAFPNRQTKASHPSVSTFSEQDTPLHPHLQPYSSTPLHTELNLPPTYPATSPLHSNDNKHRSTSKERQAEPLESPEKTELGSFHLSPLSDPSDPPSCRGHQRSHSESSRQSGRSVKSNSYSTSEPELTSRGRRHAGEDSKDKSDDQEQEEAKTDCNEANFSFQQSFMDMDEPPIAFNDSWGLDACTEANPGCFSLRLEDSGGSSQQDQSTGPRKTSSFSTDCQPSPSALGAQSPKSHGGVSNFPTSRAHSAQPLDHPTPETNSLLDSKIWDSWQEDQEEEVEALPLSQRLIPNAQLQTPAAASHNKRRRTLVPITPMPHYSDMDTPDLKTKLNRFGVRPLPKRQMILKLKEIHQYTHQLVNSDSDGEAPSAGRAAQAKPPPSSSSAAGSSRPASCAQTVRFKEPSAPTGTSPLKHGKEEAELLSASQGSNTSSTAEESDRSNPELCVSSDGGSDSDGGISASQVASRLQDRLRAVRSFILSDSALYSQILQYQPVVLSQLQDRLKAAGIRLGAAKLVDYLDSQCITFTTAKPGHSAPSRRRVKKTKAARGGGAGRKKVGTAAL
ncbi:structure-specific endonuclease subunit SLX4 [Tautogolabrus adspersus]